LHHRLLAAGARIRPHRGWEQSLSIGAPDAEAQALRSGVVLADLSAQHLVLAQARELASWLPFVPGVGRVARVANAGALLRCCRLTADSALLLGAAPIELPAVPPGCAHRTDLTSGRTIVAVAGPGSADLLGAATQVDLRDRTMPDGRCLETSVARVPATILRFDRQGIRSYEILVPRDYGEYVWDVLLDAGAPLDVRPVGVAALEAGD
jgi:glycine cleavage system aminomethyltransferase T